MKLNALFAGLLAGVAVVGSTFSALADGRNLVVVELFTSQGCSSCPPADALLGKLAARDDVLPLALHVDYWDYIGWADSFARPEHTKRQKAYAHVAGSRTIYTPQIVVAGDQQIVGAKPMDVADAIMAHLSRGPLVTLSASNSGDTVQIVAEPTGRVPGPVLIQLVRYRPDAVVEILHGENAGKTISYSNIVTDWSVVGDWTGKDRLELEAPISGEDAAAVIVQVAGNGHVLGAVKVD